MTVTLAGPKLPEPGEPVSRSALGEVDAKAVVAALEARGLRVAEHSGLTRSLRVTGTVAQMEDAFRAGLGRYRTTDGTEFRAREGELQIPAELEGLVTGVFGLDQRRVAHRRRAAGGRVCPPAGKGAAAAGPGPAAPLLPGQVAAHYGFPAATGAGQTVAIAEFGGGYFAADLEALCKKNGTKVPKVTTQSVNGAPAYTLAEIEKLPKSQQQEELEQSIEVNMDVQVVAGIAPEADIVVYFSTFDEKGWVDLLNDVVKGTPQKSMTLSVSWGQAEDDKDWSKAALDAINERLQMLANLGITVCVAAGDDGTGDQENDGKAHIDFPASSPYVLAVGGTMLDGDTEVVWWEAPGERKNGGGSTGGGVSVVFPRPSWQDVHVASLNPGSIDGRVVPDVAALAGPPNYELIVVGKDSANGGTSAATPVWAALLALVASAGWKPAFLSPLLYGPGGQPPAGEGSAGKPPADPSPAGEPLGATVCVDVTSGNNTSPDPGKGYEAGPGYDAVSGWGVPNGAALAAALTRA